MFYAARPDEALRLGDVVRGFVLGAAEFDQPDPSPMDYRINVRRPAYAVVLTPCCSIGEKMLSVAPLLAVHASFFRNPYLAEDLTRANRPMTAQEAVPPEEWKRLGERERQRRLARNGGRSLQFLRWFVYAEHALLPRHEVKVGKEALTVGSYMVDFRQMHRIESRSIANPKQSPLHAKVLQLSVQTRAELREKLAHYFGRPAPEDAAELEA